MSLRALLKPFEYSQVQILQRTDEYCNKQLGSTGYIGLPQEGNFYLGVADMLFQRSGRSTEDKLVLPDALRNHVIRACHENREGTRPGHQHRSADDTATYVTSLFHSPGLSHIARNLARDCDRCATAPRQVQQVNRAPAPKEKKRRNNRKRNRGQQTPTTAANKSQQVAQPQDGLIYCIPDDPNSQFDFHTWTSDEKAEVERRTKAAQKMITISFPGGTEVKIPA